MTCKLWTLVASAIASASLGCRANYYCEVENESSKEVKFSVVSEHFQSSSVALPPGQCVRLNLTRLADNEGIAVLVGQTETSLGYFASTSNLRTSVRFRDGGVDVTNGMSRACQAGSVDWSKR